MADANVQTVKTNRREIPVSPRPLVMGILNVTPDSFSDGGRHILLSQAVFRVEEMIAEGADIIDVGGESSRPGSFPIPVEEELARVLPVLREYGRKCPVPLSIDTWKPEVARAAVVAGAEIVNDVTGLRNPAMLELVQSGGTAVIAMHMRGMPWNMQDLPPSPDIMGEIKAFFADVMAKPVAPDRLILDPGIGFGKTLADNLTIIRRIRELTGFGPPVMAGPSRKSFIGSVADAPVDQRLPGSLAAAVLAVAGGARIIRCHDVAATVQALRVARSILGDTAT